jgi:hypothetical protein
MLGCIILIIKLLKSNPKKPILNDVSVKNEVIETTTAGVVPPVTLLETNELKPPVDTIPSQGESQKITPPTF